eukprot:gene26006-20754_t
MVVPPADFSLRSLLLDSGLHDAVLQNEAALHEPSDSDGGEEDEEAEEGEEVEEDEEYEEDEEEEDDGDLPRLTVGDRVRLRPRV